MVMLMCIRYNWLSQDQLPRLIANDRNAPRCLAHLIHGLAFLNVTFASLPELLRRDLVAAVERNSRGITRSLSASYGVIAGLSGR